MRAEVVRPHANWGPRISAIPIASTEGLLDVGIYRGNVNSDVFLDFVHDHLAPNVNPFNGINPRSIVVMDNAAIHHTADVVRAINATGALLVYLPPYSPDFMPCEGIISQVKSWIRENDQEWRMCDQPENMVMEGFLSVFDEQVRNYIRHSEYL